MIYEHCCDCSVYPEGSPLKPGDKCNCLAYRELSVEHRNGHHKSCPYCDIDLSVIENHCGGGSHYWHLVCIECEREFYYDTYRWKLEERQQQAPDIAGPLSLDELLEEVKRDLNYYGDWVDDEFDAHLHLKHYVYPLLQEIVRRLNEDRTL